MVEGAYSEHGQERKSEFLSKNPNATDEVPPHEWYNHPDPKGTPQPLEQSAIGRLIMCLCTSVEL